MFYGQNLPKATKSIVKIKLSDFSKGVNTTLNDAVLPLNYAVNTYNFDFNSGSLIDGLGAKELEIKYQNSTKKFIVPAGVDFILGCWTYVRYDSALDEYVPLLIIYGDDENMYYGRVLGNDNTFTSMNCSFGNMPNCINLRVGGEDFFYVFGEGKILKFDGTNNTSVFTENVPSITSLAYHAGRLFATISGDENKLMFSDDLNPTNWNVSAFEGGYIELADARGRLKRVIEAGGFVYIIREYGITRLQAYGLQSDFSIKNMYLSTGKIYSNTAVLCGRIIVVLCQDGLYYFNGRDMKKIDVGLDGYFKNVDNENAVAAFLDGKYYLACKLNFADNKAIGCESGSYTNNALIELDLNNFDIKIARGINIQYITPLQVAGIDKVIMCANQENSSILAEICNNGANLSHITTKNWQSPFTDFGYPNFNKILKNLILYTKNNIKIEINADGKVYNFEAKGGINPSKIPIYLRGNRFSISFVSDSVGNEISSPYVELELV